LLNELLQDSDVEVQEALRILEKEVTRAEKIVASLLDLSRARAPERRSVLVNELIREACGRARVAGGESVTVTTELDGTLPPILADPDQLSRVFENLILNAMQAMPDGGRLTLKSAVSYLGWVAISIADTGVGIPAENLEKVFDPLFTTKVKGVGLGLAIARSLVEGHEGTIAVQSQAGKGSTFTVNLPLWGTADL
jgi:signal transduction histidine kinase